MRSIINSLLDSFQVLFSREYDCEGKTPPATILANSGKFKIKNRPDYQRALKAIEDLAGDLRHPNKMKLSQSMSRLTKEVIKRSMKDAKDIWLWALEVIHVGNIPKDQLIEFKNFDP